MNTTTNVLRGWLALCLALCIPGCGDDPVASGDGSPDGHLDADGDADVDGDTDADVDADADADGDADGDADADWQSDGDMDQTPLSCGFDYEARFDILLRPGPLPSQAEPSHLPGHVAHAEPPPPGYKTLRPKAPGDPDLVMPTYSDNMPLFDRATPWEGQRRCFETPNGPQMLTEEEAYDLYSHVAEAATGTSMDTAEGVRTVVGLRGSYPGTFFWNGNAPDRFNDTLVLLWVEDGQPQVREYPVHTDVGARDFGYHSSSSLRPDRRYRYINGWHRGYNALRIAEDSYRVRDDSNNNGHWDDDRNGWLSPRTADDHDRPGGAHNIHMGSVDAPLGSAAVGGWSAGCQVIPGMASWTAFIFDAWTEMDDPVDYMLVDVRDIPQEVWQPCSGERGTHRCPLVIDSLPYSHSGTTAGGESSFDLYNCSIADESGPEVVYAFSVDRSGTLSATVDCVDPVDIDIHLLDGDDPDACLARGHLGFHYSLTPGRYLIVADTFADGRDLSGPYTLQVELR